MTSSRRRKTHIVIIMVSFSCRRTSIVAPYYASVLSCLDRWRAVGPRNGENTLPTAIISKTSHLHRPIRFMIWILFTAPLSYPPWDVAPIHHVIFYLILISRYYHTFWNTRRDSIGSAWIPLMAQEDLYTKKKYEWGRRKCGLWPQSCLQELTFRVRLRTTSLSVQCSLSAAALSSIWGRRHKSCINQASNHHSAEGVSHHGIICGLPSLIIPRRHWSCLFYDLDSITASTSYPPWDDSDPSCHLLVDCYFNKLRSEICVKRVRSAWVGSYSKKKIWRLKEVRVQREK